MKGLIFDIQHFCVDDGPGIRTTVFMKGCPLRCAWCHNPEGFCRKREISYREEACAVCGKCVENCPNRCHQWKAGRHYFDRGNCTLCGKCTEVCDIEALKMVGRWVTVEEVMSEILKDRLFYDTSGGGITLSGGEPFYQSEFAVALLKAAKQEGLHTCVETCGLTQEHVIREAAAYTDLFLLDVKETDPVRHVQFTGVDNKLILNNGRVLATLGKEIILRCPIIPGCNDREEHYKNIAVMADSLSTVSQIHLEPYHPLGVNKYYELGMEPMYAGKAFMDSEKIEETRKCVQTYTKKEVLIS